MIKNDKISSKSSRLDYQIRTNKLLLYFCLVGITITLFILPISFAFISLSFLVGVVWGILSNYHWKSNNVLFLLFIVAEIVFCGTQLTEYFFENETILASIQFLSTIIISRYLCLSLILRNTK